MTDGPHRVSDREVPLAITGYFMATLAPNVPVLIGMAGTDDLFVCVFSSEEKLRQVMETLRISYERVAIVTDGHELIDDINATNMQGDRPYRIRIAVDPYEGSDGRVKFLEPMLPPPQAPSALATMQHADACQVVRENGVAVWMCVGTCPAMHEFIRSGQVDHQPREQLDPDQAETVKRAVQDHALGALDARDEGGER